MAPIHIAGFTALPLSLPQASVALPSPAVHYLYIRPHAPQVPNADTSRSLFASNVPFDASESNLRSFFSSHLGGSKIERVEFDAEHVISGHFGGRKRHGTEEQSLETAESNGAMGRKRKRRDDEADLGAPEAQMPPVWDSPLLRSGACAVIVFVDKVSAEVAMKACERASAAASKHPERMLKWDNGGRVFGIERYRKHHQMMYPSHAELLKSSTAYLSRFTKLEEARDRARLKARTVPDEDGFITVTKGSRTAPARLEDATQALEKEKERAKKRIGEGFYRFQVREKAKGRGRELRRNFEKDVERVEAMKRRRSGKD